MDNLNNNTESNTKVSKDVVLIQQFTAACAAILKLLKEHSTGNEQFQTSVDKLYSSFSAMNFEIEKFLRKIYDVIKPENICQMVIDKNEQLFSIKNAENKIVSIIPGINIKQVYPLLDSKNKEIFWQYFDLMILSTFNVFNTHNPKKIQAHKHIVNMMTVLGERLDKTGVLFNETIFNPYLGFVSDNKGYSIEDMYHNVEPLQTGADMERGTLTHVLKYLNLKDVLGNEEELNKKLSALSNDDLNSATDQILNLLGATNDPRVKKTCSKLVKNIVDELKVNGIGNLQDVLKNVTERSRSEIEVNEMTDTMSYVQNFMKDGETKIKEIKDENNNPIGEQLFSKLLGPMMRMAGK